MILSTAALAETDEGAVWRGCLSDFDDYIANNITGPAIEHSVDRIVTKGNETNTITHLEGVSFSVSDEGDSIKQRLARPMILGMAGMTGNKDVIQLAQDAMEESFKSGCVLWCVDQHQLVTCFSHSRMSVWFLCLSTSDSECVICVDRH